MTGPYHLRLCVIALGCDLSIGMSEISTAEPNITQGLQSKLGTVSLYEYIAYMSILTIVSSLDFN